MRVESDRCSTVLFVGIGLNHPSLVLRECVVENRRLKMGSTALSLKLGDD